MATSALNSSIFFKRVKIVDGHSARQSKLKLQPFDKAQDL